MNIDDKTREKEHECKLKWKGMEAGNFRVLELSESIPSKVSSAWCDEDSSEIFPEPLLDENTKRGGYEADGKSGQPYSVHPFRFRIWSEGRQDRGKSCGIDESGILWNSQSCCEM